MSEGTRDFFFGKRKRKRKWEWWDTTMDDFCTLKQSIKYGYSYKYKYNKYMTSLHILC